MSCGSGSRLCKGSLLCLRERCCKGRKTSINHHFVVLALDWLRCMAWMSTLASGGVAGLKLKGGGTVQGWRCCNSKRHLLSGIILIRSEKTSD